MSSAIAAIGWTSGRKAGVNRDGRIRNAGCVKGVHYFDSTCVKLLPKLRHMSVEVTQKGKH